MILLMGIMSLLQEAGGFARSSTGRHATPQGVLDYIVVTIAVVMVIVVFVICIRLFLWPKEKSPDHIKRRILKDEF